jgi:hypothetical protein
MGVEPHVERDVGDFNRLHNVDELGQEATLWPGGLFAAVHIQVCAGGIREVCTILFIWISISGTT